MYRLLDCGLCLPFQYKFIPQCDNGLTLSEKTIPNDLRCQFDVGFMNGDAKMAWVLWRLCTFPADAILLPSALCQNIGNGGAEIMGVLCESDVRRVDLAAYCRYINGI